MEEAELRIGPESATPVDELVELYGSVGCAFCENLGYAEVRDHGPGTLRAFVRFDDPSSG